MATQKEVSAMFTKLLAAFNEFKPANAAATVKVYADALADVPAEALGMAVDEWIAGEKWFPKVAELRKAARLGKNGHFKSGVIEEELPGIYIITNHGFVPFNMELYKELTHE